MTVRDFPNDDLLELRATSQLLLQTVENTDLSVQTKEELVEWASTASPSSNRLIVDLIDTLIAERAGCGPLADGEDHPVPVPSAGERLQVDGLPVPGETVADGDGVVS